MKWEANGGNDLHLSPFKLTNRQMFWLAMAHVDTMKYQDDYPIKYSNGPEQLDSIYVHVLYKRIRNFRQAFGCQKLNTLEEMKFDNYVRIVNSVRVGYQYTGLTY